MKKLMIFPVVLMLSGCITNNPNTLGFGTIGGVGGGLLGSTIGQGKGRLLTTTGGTILGGLIGTFLGNKFDTINHNQSQINRNTIGINQLSTRPTNQTSPGFYHYGSSPSFYGNQNIPITCRITNNYVRCNGG